MYYNLSEEEEMIREVARTLAEEKIKPLREEMDRKSYFPPEIREEFGKSDLLRVFIPEEYEGLGMGFMGTALATEEISIVDGGVGTAYSANGLGATPIILFGSEEQKRKYLPPTASGEKWAAFALTEPDAGSDAGNVQLRADKEGDYYILNGNKVFITNGGLADYYVVIVATDRKKGIRGLSAVIVEKDTEGFTFGKEEDKMGIRAAPTRELVFSDCKVPRENLLRREGFGFMIAMKTFDRTRAGVAAQAVGIAQGALTEAISYANVRKQFGKRIGEFQAIQIKLAEMATKVEAARALTYLAARYIDSGATTISKISSQAKLFASDVAMQVTIEAVQVFGGYGYMRDYPVEKMMRDAKITQIYEGTSEIQKLVIANELLKEDLRKKK
ncbi:acyl-CoA dehydrogenase family protein [candidate division WOR-3 bacterium]|nr:acyl-CoA dehydrogenase family protein [candidate division WOR-3 bacterium]MCK4527330.1 acyl-CoA dehydrogenase family protein [candidate division WOR-3 bacterium]